MNTENWDKLARPPADALKTIKGGRLSGMTDVKPMWRYRAMTEVYGECGDGWKFEIVRLWTEPGCNEQVFAFAQVNLFVRYDAQWSDPIPGVGGHFLVVKESAGLHANDEAYKMAITDALSTAMKMIGVAAAIHMGEWDGSKYRDEIPPTPASPQTAKPATGQPASSGGVVCPKCQGPMWDNRTTKKSPRQPDYKCKDKTCDGVIWPPKKTAEEFPPETRFPDDEQLFDRNFDPNDDVPF